MIDQIDIDVYFRLAARIEYLLESEHYPAWAYRMQFPLKLYRELYAEIEHMLPKSQEYIDMVESMPIENVEVPENWYGNRQ